MKAQSKSDTGKSVVELIVFLAGFVGALIFGWVVFPNLLYSQKPQPMDFSHAAHQDSTCEDCHAFRADGTFTGIPRMEKCKECHESPMGSTEAERILVEEYIQKDKEIPWRVYSWQPDNVFFSHAPHKAKGLECAQCHRDVWSGKTLPPYKENLLTGYSSETMKMIVCEKCHADQVVNNECGLCHK
jgi:menaquinone reductase, multiheme cytochrome c subunit